MQCDFWRGKKAPKAFVAKITSVSLHLIPAARKQKGLWHKQRTVCAAALSVWTPVSHGTISWRRLMCSACVTSAGVKFPANKKKKKPKCSPELVGTQFWKQSFLKLPHHLQKLISLFSCYMFFCLYAHLLLFQIHFHVCCNIRWWSGIISSW